MAGDGPLYYWDTCMFLEHLREEPVAATKRRAVTRILMENQKKGNRIITSVLTHAEALPKKLQQTDITKEDQYWSYFTGRHFMDVDISRPVITLAREIRDFYYKDFDPATHQYQMIGLGDSIHLATAIVFRVDELHTRDTRRSGGNLGLVGLGTLTQDGKIAGQWDLRIVDPEDPEPELFDT